MNQCTATTKSGTQCRKTHNRSGSDVCHIHSPETTQGCVYVLTNKSMEGLIKIGWTRGTPEDRARQLTTTSVATPFVVEHSVESDNAPALEKRAHDALCDQRVAPNREFFRATVAQAVAALASPAAEAPAVYTVAVPAGTAELHIVFSSLAV